MTAAIDLVSYKDFETQSGTVSVEVGRYDMKRVGEIGLRLRWKSVPAMVKA